MLSIEIKQRMKKLEKLYKSKEVVEEKYEKLLRKAQCTSCDKYNDGMVSKYVERFSSCDMCGFAYELRSLGQECESFEEDIDNFIEGEYAKSVFEYGAKKKLVLIESDVDEEVTWDKAFGQCFDEVPKSLRHSLVGLIEGWGRYRFR